MAGLSSTGFTVKTLEEIRTELIEKVRSQFGQSIDTSDGSVIGRLIGIFAEQIAEIWELAEAVYSSADPDKAVDAALASIAAITGTIQNQAKPSTVTLTMTGDPSTSITSGSRAATASTGVLFQTTEDGLIALAGSWAGSTAYAIGDTVTNSSNIYRCSVAGTSAASGGPSGTGTDIVDGSVEWDFLGEGTGFVDVAAESVDDGPIVALARDIAEIDTPVGGWKSVINVLDATPGRLKESNEDLRVRREQELAAAGASSLDSIRAELLKVTGVTAVTVFMNTTESTDADGLPPHSVETLVQGGEDQAIFDALLASVAAGIQTHGSTTGTAVDSQEISHTIKFSRPTEIEIYADVTLIKDPAVYPATGDSEIKAAIVDFGDAQATGKDAVASAIIAQCFKVPGVLDVSQVFIGTAPSPNSSDTIEINVRELAVYDTSRITVSSSDGTP